MASQQQLTEAEAALHQLATGKKAVRLQQNGRIVEYLPANMAQLRAYINELKIALGQSATGSRKPVGFL